MSYVGEFIGGPCDGRLEAIPGIPPPWLMVPTLPVFSLVSKDNPIDLDQILELRYVRRRGLDGELWYVWDRLLS